MFRIKNFFKRNLKEMLRDPIIYIFCLGFPVVMLLLFQIINNYSNGHTSTFNMSSLLPAIIMFSYTFVMLTMGLLVSKDRQTMFLKRLYSSPMKSHEFILGYFLVGFLIAICQTIICIIAAFIISLIFDVEFIGFWQIILMICSQLPILITMVCLGILFGVLFNDKSAPGICSIFISLSGILGGCWMPVETMGGFETFCKILPFYPSVCLGRIVTNATNQLGVCYVFDSNMLLGLIPIALFMIASVVMSCVAFKKSMVSDK